MGHGDSQWHSVAISISARLVLFLGNHRFFFFCFQPVLSVVFSASTHAPSKMEVCVCARVHWMMCLAGGVRGLEVRGYEIRDGQRTTPSTHMPVRPETTHLSSGPTFRIAPPLFYIFLLAAVHGSARRF